MPHDLPIPANLPDYDHITEQYNRRVAHLSKLRATLSVVYTYSDQEGTHHLQGDGRLAVVLPDRIRLSVSHVAMGTLLWAGSNTQHYWLLDLRDTKRVTFGRHDGVLALQDRGDSWLVHPLLMLRLLGIVPLHSSAKPGQVMWHRGHLLIEPPDAKMLLTLEPKTYRPVRIDLLDDDGQSTLTAHLSNYQPVNIEGRPRDGQTRLATRFTITQAGRRDQLRLTLGSESLADRPINLRVFDFNRLLKLFKPQERIDLDQPD